MKLQFAGFEWDDGNRGHCQKHGLSQTEIEGFFQQDNLLVAPDLLHAEREERYLAILVEHGRENRCWWSSQSG